MDSTLTCHVFLLNTNTEPVFFFPRKVTALAKLMFITLVLFQFGSFIVSGSFQLVYTKSIYSGPTIYYVNHAK